MRPRLTSSVPSGQPVDWSLCKRPHNISGKTQRMWSLCFLSCISSLGKKKKIEKKQILIWYHTLTLKRGRSHLGFVDPMTCAAVRRYISHTADYGGNSKPFQDVQCSLHAILTRTLLYLVHLLKIFLVSCTRCDFDPVTLKAWSRSRDMLRRAVLKSSRIKYFLLRCRQTIEEWDPSATTCVN